MFVPLTKSTKSLKTTSTSTTRGSTKKKKKKSPIKKKAIVPESINIKLGRKMLEVTFDKRQWILKIGKDGPFYYPKLSGLYNKIYEELLRSKAKVTVFDPAALKRTLKDAEDIFYKLADELCKKLDVAREEISKE